MKIDSGEIATYTTGIIIGRTKITDAGRRRAQFGNGECELVTAITTRKAIGHNTGQSRSRVV